jgi:PAS domain S-box-containing protein
MLHTYSNKNKFDLEVEKQQGEAYIKNVIERSITNVFIYQENSIVYANDALKELLGLAEEELYNSNPLSFIHHEDREVVKERAIQWLGDLESPNEFEFRIINQKGETRWVRLIATLTSYRGKSAILGVVFDVTEQNLAENPLWGAAQLNQMLLDAIPHPAMLIRKDRIILAANRVAREVGAKVGGYCWYEFGQSEYIPDEDKQYIEEHGGFAPPGGTQCTFCLAEESMRRKRPNNDPELEAFGQLWDTWWIPINDEVYLHYAINITEKRKAEKALKESEERYRLLIETMNEGLVIQDQSGSVSFVNNKLCEILGYAKYELIGHSLADFLTADHKKIEAILGRQIDETISFETSLRRKDGKKIRASLIIESLIDENGVFMGSFVFITDITELSMLRQQARNIEGIEEIVGRHISMRQLYEEIKEYAAYDFPVLIQGESGTGKELSARAIHNLSSRAEKKFVAVHCSALPEGLLESELFGHVKGAFTGALRDRKGRFELGDGGTVFLDEVGDLSPVIQTKLLRVLQEGTIERVGDEKTISVNIRIISAANKDLEREIQAGRFREDLYYRLSVLPIQLPPLRTRAEDITILIEHFLKKYAGDHKGKISISQQALSMLVHYQWPGNVRELENALRFAIVRSKGQMIKPVHLPPSVLRLSKTTPMKRHRRRKTDEKAAKAALVKARGNKTEAAKILGISRATLYRILATETS